MKSKDYAETSVGAPPGPDGPSGPAQPVVHWAKEAKAIKAALDRGYTQEQVLACWQASQESPRWKGQWIPMAFMVEDLGEFLKTGPPRKWTMGPRLSTQPKYRDHRDYPKEF